MSGIVHLNVGGVRYDTCKQTLSRIGDSMLAALVDRWCDGDDKEVFIDRDGKLFQFVLNYLRDGDDDIVLPEDAVSLKQMRKEACYYGLTRLENTIQDKLDVLKAKPKGSKKLITLHSGEVLRKIKFMDEKHFSSCKKTVNNCAAIYGNFDFSWCGELYSSSHREYSTTLYYTFLNKTDKHMVAEVVCEFDDCYFAYWLDGLTNGRQTAHIPKTWVQSEHIDM